MTCVTCGRVWTPRWPPPAGQREATQCGTCFLEDFLRGTDLHGETRAPRRWVQQDDLDERHPGPWVSVPDERSGTWIGDYEV